MNNQWTHSYSITRLQAEIRSPNPLGESHMVASYLWSDSWILKGLCILYISVGPKIESRQMGRYKIKQLQLWKPQCLPRILLFPRIPVCYILLPDGCGGHFSSSWHVLGSNSFLTFRCQEVYSPPHRIRYSNQTGSWNHCFHFNLSW